MRPAHLGIIALGFISLGFRSTAWAKPLHKHPDFGIQTTHRDIWSLTRLCYFEARRDTKVAGTPVAAGKVLRSACNTVGEALIPAVYDQGMRFGAGGKVYWGRRIDTHKIDFVMEHPKRFGAIAVRTDYDMAWSPLISGTSAEERSVFFVGVAQEDGTFWVDIIGPEGEPIGSIPHVRDIVDYRSAYLVEATYPFGTTHQVVSIDGELLTPLLPELTRRGDNWVFEVDGGLLMPVRPNGVVGRSNQRIQGYRPLGAYDNDWAFSSVWELPDGTTAYGLVDSDFTELTHGIFRTLEHTEDDHGFGHIVGHRLDGTWAAYTYEAHYAPAEFATAESAEELEMLVERFYQGRIDRDVARTKAWEAELAERKRRQAAAEKAWAEAKAAEQARRAASSGGVAAPTGKSCQQSFDERNQLTLDEAHWAMKHCYYTLSYPEWLAVDRVYMALQAGPPAPITPAQPSYRPRSTGQDQSAITRQRYMNDLDRYMRGASSYDPSDTDW